MAEVIGLVASGISIAQIAGQVTSSIVRIKGFWDQVKAAPEDINYLLREVDSFSLIFQHIQDDLTWNALPELVFNGDGLRQSLELCRSGAFELEELANELAGKFDGKSCLKRKIGSVKVVLKQDDMKRLRRRLKTAVRLLSLAYQCHTSVMIRLQPDIIAARLSKTMAVSSSQQISELEDVTAASSKMQVVQKLSSESSNLVTQYYQYWVTSPSWLRFLFGSLEYHRRVHQRRGRKQESFVARYKFPDYFSTRVWDIAGSTSVSDWSVNFRTYRVISENASIFEAIWCGDISCVQSMLASKEAFVTDRDQYGQTLLHRAARRGTVDICEVLISEGADVCILTDSLRTPLSYALSFPRASPHPISEKAHDALIRLLVNAGAFQDLVSETYALAYFRGDEDLFQYLQQQTYPAYYKLPLEERLGVAYSMSCQWPQGAALTKLALTPGRIDEEIATHVDENGFTLLHYAIHQYIRFCCRNQKRELNCCYHNIRMDSVKDNISGPNNPWRGLVKDLIRAGVCLHTPEIGKKSFLYHIIRTTWVFWDGEFEWASMLFASILKFLKIWLFDLQEQGIDLERYGANERALHLAGTVEIVRRDTMPLFTWYDDGIPLDLISFTCGPRLADWHFYFSEPTDIFTGEFWAMIENPVSQDDTGPRIPGSWIEYS